MRLPLLYHDTVGFGSYHTASLGAVAALLPSDRLRPARWFDGSGLVSIDAFRYRCTTWAGPEGTHLLAPYGEVGVSLGVTLGAAPRGLPAVRNQVAGFVLHLPVTTREARDAGREFWGLPKFVADMDFVDRQDRHQVTVSDDGAEILTLTVPVRGPLLRRRRPLAVYSVRRGELLETVVQVSGRRRLWRGSGPALAWGQSPLADQLRRLGVSPQPLATFAYLEHRSLLPAGRAVGSARDWAGHAGTQRERGRFTVRYRGTEAIDQYGEPTARPLNGRLPEQPIRR